MLETATHTSDVRSSRDVAPLRTDPRPPGGSAATVRSLLGDEPGWTDNLASAAQSNMVLGIAVAVAAVVVVAIFAVVWYVPRKR